jgi:hypothetical protein
VQTSKIHDEKDIKIKSVLASYFEIYSNFIKHNLQRITNIEIINRRLKSFHIIMNFISGKKNIILDIIMEI